MMQQPRYSKHLFTQRLQDYRRSPDRFRESEVAELRAHAEYYQMPFEEIDPDEAKFNLFRAFRYLGQGYLQGFTTLRIGEQAPVNPYERIAKSIGRAAGFAGYVPTLGTPVGAAMAAAVGGKSLPLLASGKVMEYIAPGIDKVMTSVGAAAVKSAMAGKTGAVASALKLLSHDAAEYVIRGGVQHAVTGAIGSWQEGIGAMMQGALSGASMGAADRLIANALSATIGGSAGGPLAGGATSQALARTVAGSMWRGLPSTLRGQTSPEQVYEYLVGGFFAYKSLPYADAKAREIFAKNIGKPYVPEVEDFDGYAEASEVVQAKVREIYNKNIGEAWDKRAMKHLMLDFLHKHGIVVDEDDEVLEQAVNDVYMNRRTLEREQEDLKEKLARQKGQREAVEGEMNRVVLEAETEELDVVETVDAPEEEKVQETPSEELEAPSVEAPEVKSPESRIEKAALDRVEEDTPKMGLADRFIDIFRDRWKINLTYEEAFGELERIDNTLAGIQAMKDGQPVSEFIPPSLISRDGITPSQMAITNSVITDGDSEISDHLRTLAESDPTKEYLIDPPFTTEANVVAFIPGKDQVEGKVEPNFDNLHTAIIGRSTIVIPDEVDRDKYPYWYDVVEILTEAGYTDLNDAEFGTGIFRKQIIVDPLVAKAHATLIRTALDQVWTETDGTLLTLNQTVETALHNALIRQHGDKLTDEMVQAKVNEFIDYLGEDLSLENVDKFVSDNPDLDFGEEEQRKLRFFAKHKSSYSHANTYAIVENQATGEITIRPIKQGENIGGKVISTERPNVFSLFDRLGLPKDKDHLITINRHIIITENGSQIVDDTHPHAAADGDERMAKGTLKIAYDSFKGEYYFFGGRNDHAEYNFIAKHEDLDEFFGTSVEEIRAKIHEIMAPDGMTTKQLKDINADALIFAQKMGQAHLLDKDRQLNPKEKAEVRLLQERYYKQWANSLLWLKDFNMQDDFSFIHERGFTKHASDMNKRNQIVFNTGAPPTIEDVERIYYRRSGVRPVDFNNIKMAVFDAGYYVEMENKRRRANYEKEIEQIKANAKAKGIEPVIPDFIPTNENTQDGNVYVREELLYAFNKSTALPTDGNVNKNFMIHTNKEQGMVMGKYLMKVAGPVELALMDMLGVDVLGDHNAIKHFGRRTAINAFFNRDTQHFELDMDIEEAKQSIFTFPVDALRMTMSEQSTRKSINNPVGVPKQIFTNLMGDLETREDFLRMIESSKKGTTWANKFVDKLIGKTSAEINENDLRYLGENIDNIGVDGLVALLKTGNPRILKEVVLNITKHNASVDDLDNKSGIADGKSVSYGATASLNRVLDILKDAENTNVGVVDKFAVNYVRSAINKYVMNRVSKPIIQNAAYGLKSRGHAFYPKEIKHGEMMLGANMRDLKINFFGLRKPKLNNRGEIVGRGDRYTLGELWDIYNDKMAWEDQHTKDWSERGKKEIAERKGMLENLFNGVSVQRTPQDNPAGVQVLKFTGFMDIESNEILLPGYTKEVTGGADDDGDSYYVFFGGMTEDGKGGGMKQSWIDMFRGNNDLWLDMYKKGHSIKQASYEGSLIREGIFGAQSDKAKELSRHVTSRHLIGAPGMSIQTADATIYARNLLSETVAYTQSMSEMYRAIRDTYGDDGIELLIPTDYGQYKVNVKPRAEDSELVNLAMIEKAVAITSVADPTDFAATPNIEGFQKKHFGDLFEIEIYDGKRLLSESDKHYEGIKERVRSELYGEHNAVNQAMKTKLGYLDTRFKLDKYSTSNTSTYYGTIQNALKDKDWNVDFYTVYGDKVNKIWEGLSSLFPAVFDGQQFRMNETLRELQAALKTTISFSNNKEGRARAKELFDVIYKMYPKEANLILGEADEDIYKQTISYSPWKPFLDKTKSPNRKLLEFYEFFRNEDNVFAMMDGDEHTLERFEKMNRKGNELFFTSFAKRFDETQIQHAIRVKDSVAELIQQDMADMKTLLLAAGVLNQPDNDFWEARKSRDGRKYNVLKFDVSRSINEIWKKANEFKNSVALGRNEDGSLQDAPMNTLEEADALAITYVSKLEKQWQKDLFDIFMIGTWRWHPDSAWKRQSSLVDGVKVYETDDQFAKRVKDSLHETNYSQLGLGFTAVSNEIKEKFFELDQMFFDIVEEQQDKIREHDLAEAPIKQFTPEPEVEVKSEPEAPVETAETKEPVEVPEKPVRRISRADIDTDTLNGLRERHKALVAKEQEYERDLAKIEEEIKMIDRETFIEEVKEPNAIKRMLEEERKLFAKVKLTPEEMEEISDEVISIFDELKEHMTFYGYPDKNNEIPLEGIVRGMFNKSIGQMHMNDWRALRNQMRSWRTPTALQKLLGDRYGEQALIRKVDYFLFPDAIDKRLMRTKLRADLQMTAYYDNKGRVRPGWGFRPTSTIGSMQNVFGIAIEENQRVSERKKNELQQDIDKYRVKHDKEFDILWEGITIDRDHRYALSSAEFHQKEYAKLYQEAQHPYNYREKESMLMEAERHKDLARQFRDIAKHRAEQYDNYFAEHHWAYNKVYKVMIDGKETLINGQDIVEDLNKTLNEYNRWALTMQKGKLDEDGNNIYLKKYERPIDEVLGRLADRMSEDYLKKNKIFFYDIDAVVEDIMASISAGKGIPQEIGIDGLNMIGRSMMIQDLIEGLTSREKIEEIFDFVGKYRDIHTGELAIEDYYPRQGILRGEDREATVARIREISQEFDKLNDKLSVLYDEDFTTYSAQDKHRMKIDLRKQMDALMHEYIYEASSLKEGLYERSDVISDNEAIHELAIKYLAGREREVSEDIHRAISWTSTGRRTRHQLRRKPYGGEYNRSIDGYGDYISTTTNAFHKSFMWVAGKNMIMKAARDRDFGDATPEWVNFLKLYLNDSIGNPTILTQDLLNDPKMKLKGNLYTKVADSSVSKFMYKIGRETGFIKDDMDIPEELRKVDYTILRKISQMEARYEIASLLFHPKSMMNNLYGGTQLTMVSAGVKNWTNARSIKYLRSNINPKWGSMEDVSKDAAVVGAIEDYMLSEAGITGAKHSKNVKAFINEAIKKISKDYDMSDESLLEIARKHKVSDALAEKSGWFMKKSERILRRDSFLAHYVYWHNLFDGILEGSYDDKGNWKFNPILTKLAKDGVQLTQFLYSAPYRPAIANTELGKILTRFQMWTYNSVNTRSKVLEQAKIYGFKDSLATDRFSRLFAMDMISLGLAQAFMFSMFDSALPPPWSWLKDFGRMFFGDERERDSAFMGAWPRQVAPLQMITPPVARAFPSAITAMVSGDWKRFTDYTVWTMFPYGRLARDVHKSYVNPKSTIDRFTGIPFSSLQGPEEEENKKKKKKRGKD